MNSDSLIEYLQRGFRVTVGATASLLEILQDPQKREENLSSLRSELSHMAQEWAEKGAITEREARNFVDTLLNQERSPTTNDEPGVPSSRISEPNQGLTSEAHPDLSTRPDPPATDPQVHRELHELTAQLAALRAELERVRQQD